MGILKKIRILFLSLVLIWILFVVYSRINDSDRINRPNIQLYFNDKPKFAEQEASLTLPTCYKTQSPSITPKNIKATEKNFPIPCDEKLFKNGSRKKVCPFQNVSIKKCLQIIKGEWIPDGCNLHHYEINEIRKCLTNYPTPDNIRKEIVLMGDSRLRYLWSIISDTLLAKGKQKEPKRKVNLAYTDFSTNWTVTFLDNRKNDAKLVETLLEMEMNTEKPYLLLIGNALHSILDSNNSLPALLEYKKYLRLMVPKLQALTKSMIVLCMLQAPVVEIEWNINTYTVTNAAVDAYNEASMQILESTGITIVHSIKDLGMADINKYMDGYHFGDKTNRAVMQILLNIICNRRMNFTDGSICCIPKAVPK